MDKILASLGGGIRGIAYRRTLSAGTASANFGKKSICQSGSSARAVPAGVAASRNSSDARNESVPFSTNKTGIFITSDKSSLLTEAYLFKELYCDWFQEAKELGREHLKQIKERLYDFYTA
ncbi:hypothetical protein [Alkalibacillus silvisoli]|uniref:hypothetical protein n=1 Tax=Alkalibacillus silvisoli TaxID=392823 RepID=UPI0031E36963